MTAFVNKLFTSKSFEAEFALVSGIDGQLDKRILMPDGIRSVIRHLFIIALCFDATLTYRKHSLNGCVPFLLIDAFHCNFMCFYFA